MIARNKTMRNPIRSKAFSVIAGATLATGFLLGSAPALTQQETTTVTHFIDSNTDRVPLITAFPTYPSIARRDRIQGEAKVCFMIKQDGRITRAKLKSATHRIFRKPALRAIKKSSFEPLGPKQVLAMSRTCRTFRFRLEPLVVENDDN